MRRGLVVTGLVVALIGGGVVASVFIGSAAPQNSESQSVRTTIAAGATDELAFALTSTSSGNLTLTWEASDHVVVALWPSVQCSSGSSFCPAGSALAVWVENSSGHWSMNGAIDATYWVFVDSLASGELAFNATLRESYASAGSPFASPMWPLILVVGGGILLLGGGIALFLGLYLPRGVYDDGPAEPLLLRGGEPGLDGFPTDRDEESDFLGRT